ncbi:hypothetical protein, partial [Clostridium botulinum]|uniref:hypothetical protein n=1 Tax=Clostridium botulinum TaxID=1491 RepID=UPI001968109A
DKTEILIGNEPLMFNDTIDFDNNKIIKATQKIVINNNPIIKWCTLYNASSANTLLFGIADYDTTLGESTGKELCDSFVVDNDNIWQSDKQSIQFISGSSQYDNKIRIRIAKSELIGYADSMTESQKIGLFKNYLSSKPVTIYCSKIKTIENLNIKDELQTFQGGYLQLDNSITPCTQLEYSTNLPSAIGSLTGITDKLVDDVTNVEITISDMDAEIGEARKGKTTLEERLEEDRTNILNTIGQVSNPNLLINGSPTVWQRGTTFVNKQTYTADRWFYVCYNNPEKGSLSQDVDGSIKMFNFNDSQNYIQQIIETIDSKKIVGKTITVSADMKVNNMTKGGIFIQLLGSEGIDKIDYDTVVIKTLVIKPSEISNLYKKFKLSWDIPSNIKTIAIQIGSHKTTSGIVNNDCILNIKNIKLELGSLVTPFVPRLYGEEEMLCKRYYFRNRWLSTKISGMGSKIITTTSFYYPTTMRITPTVRTLIENPIDAIRTMDYSVNIVNPSIEQIKPRQSGIINEEMIDFQFDSNLEVKDYNLEIKDYAYEFDSEIY